MEKLTEKPSTIPLEIIPFPMEYGIIDDDGILASIFSIKMIIVSRGIFPNSRLPHYSELELGILKGLQEVMNLRSPNYDDARPDTETHPIDFRQQGRQNNKSTRVDSHELSFAFRIVIDYIMAGYNGSPRRKPVRIQRIWRSFQGRENEFIPLEELAGLFSHTAEPEKSAATAISWLNKLFDKLGLDYEIERTSVYRFRKRSD